jgi:carboxyl-terminal processing protease
MIKSQKLLPIIIFFSIALGVLIGVALNFPVPEKTISKNSYKNKLNKLIAFIDSEYVDDIDTDSIVDVALDNILNELDPHSVYIPKSVQGQVAMSMKGNFVGVGINFYMHNDTLAVINTIENGPSEKAGILAGDRILFANKTKLYGRKFPSDSLYRYLQGKEGSEVWLRIFRKTENKTLKINIKRDVVTIKSVDAALMLDAKSGYIKINRFSETTYNEFFKALQTLKQKGMQTLIIDVRENGGGYMEQAIEIADELLPKDKLIVFTKNKSGRIDKNFATEKGVFETGKVFVLIDENSASASEILAGAIQDNDRGTIVGRRSFGKGLVQREMNFDDGSAVRLTIARYYTPTGRSIQKPYKKGNEEYRKDFEKRFQNGELYSQDSIKINDSLKFRTPKGKIVYGGGGIVPDVFVPISTTKIDEKLSYILQSGVLGHFVFEAMDKNRKKYMGINELQLEKMIFASNIYINHFQKYLLKNQVQIDFSYNQNIVKKAIYNEFVKQVFGDNTYFLKTIKDDAMFKKVVEIN